MCKIVKWDLWVFGEVVVASCKSFLFICLSGKVNFCILDFLYVACYMDQFYNAAVLLIKR